MIKGDREYKNGKDSEVQITEEDQSMEESKHTGQNASVPLRVRNNVRLSKDLKSKKEKGIINDFTNYV